MTGETPVGAEGLFTGWMEANVVLGGLAAVGTPLRHGWERERDTIWLREDFVIWQMQVVHFWVRWI
jgi:hypothetical protein